LWDSDSDSGIAESSTDPLVVPPTNRVGEAFGSVKATAGGSVESKCELQGWLPAVGGDVDYGS